MQGIIQTALSNSRLQLELNYREFSIKFEESNEGIDLQQDQQLSSELACLLSVI